MPIAIACPTCRAQFSVDDRHAGRKAKCGKCGAAIQIPAAVPQVVAVPTPPVEEKPSSDFHSKIAGVTMPNSDRSDRQAIIRRCQVGERLNLVREPSNRHDKNAIAVRRQNGEQLGYINSELAEELCEWLTQEKRVVVTISDITGGDGGGWFTEAKSHGVNIRIQTFGTLMPKDGANLSVDQEIVVAIAKGDVERIYRTLERRSPTLRDRHYIFCRVVEFGFQNRATPPVRRLCENVAWLHIGELPKLMKSLKNEAGRVERIHTFQRLATLYTEDGNIPRAIEVYEKAIALGLKDGTKKGYEGRIETLRKKLRK